MSVYASKDDIALARSVDLVPFLQARGYELEKIGSQFVLAEHDSLRIDGNRWNWFSRSVGGNAIDFLVKYEGMKFVDAVRELVGHLKTMRQHPLHQPARSGAVQDRKDFIIPEAADDNKRAFWYLCVKRKINKMVFNAAVASGSVYQNRKGGVTFIGFDKFGEARYAMSRSTYDDGKYEASGSDKRFGFCLHRAGSTNLMVFESAIDALSHASLHKNADTHRLSLGGVSSLALLQFLQDYPDIKTVTFALDNDDRGRAAAASLSDLVLNGEMFTGRNFEVSTQFPPHGKDWNAALMDRQNKNFCL